MDQDKDSPMEFNHSGSSFEEATSPIGWDPKQFEILTRSVEKTLEPLVIQVTTLVSSCYPGNKIHGKKGKSKKAHVVVAAVERATENFVIQGRQIANENPDMREDLLTAIDEVLRAGHQMSLASREFAQEPCSSAIRKNMVVSGRNLLSSVTRLLILADMIDVKKLMAAIRVVEDQVKCLQDIRSHPELLAALMAFGQNAEDLVWQTAKRQHELTNLDSKDSLACARAILKKHSTLLQTSSKLFVQYPDLHAAKSNRDYVIRQICEAINSISEVAQESRLNSYQDGLSDCLERALDDFEANLIINPLTFDEDKLRSLEDELEAILSRTAIFTESSSMRDYMKNRILSAGSGLSESLQQLLGEYLNSTERKTSLDVAIDVISKKTNDLRRQLHRGVQDQVSDWFINIDVPLQKLIEAAERGNEPEVEQHGVDFTSLSHQVTHVAKMCCAMANNEEGIKMVLMSAQQIEALTPEVVNAARILANDPASSIGHENLTSFKDMWFNQVLILIDAVDDISNVEDFLAVTETHILEDGAQYQKAYKDLSESVFKCTADTIRARCQRIIQVVSGEMDNYQPGIYTEGVLERIKVLQGEILPNFVTKSSLALESLKLRRNNLPKEEEADLNEALQWVYDGVSEIRQMVLFETGFDEMTENASDFEWSKNASINKKNLSRNDSLGPEVDEYPDITGVKNAQDAMKKLPLEEKAKIEQQVEVFKVEKRKFDQEVSKWDETGNDIIRLAKHMCGIMTDMTDFTRGQGPLKTTMAVIGAAKKISEAGTKLDKLARQIADQCPESSTKKDLIAYLQRIALYCHQLNITSKVKADVQNVSGELVVSGLDSATSLIQASKNLMNAVVLTVKASYVASTKYPRQAAASGLPSTPVVIWRMKAPEKKPLVRLGASHGNNSNRGSLKSITAFLALSEFQDPLSGAGSNREH